MAKYNALVPLGTLTISAIGATVPLSVNCGPYGGQTELGNYVPGNAFRGFMLQASADNSGNLYLLPRGKTAAANQDLIFAVLVPGESLVFPMSGMSGIGVLPENFCLDTDAVAGEGYLAVAYGYGTLG